MKSTSVVAAGLFTALLAVAGCSNAVTTSAPTTPAASAPTAADGSAPSASSSASSTSSRSSAPAPTTESLPASRKNVGTITQGRATTHRGEGDQAVSYQVGGPFAVVVELDCSTCTGTVRLNTAKRPGSPWFEGPAPTRTVALENVFASAKKTTVIVRATGTWSLKLSSWNDTPFRPGTRSGEGAAIVKIAGPSTGLRVRTTPKKGESMMLRFYEASPAGTSGGTRVLAGDEPLDEVIDISTPALVAVNGRGSWSFEPTRAPSGSSPTTASSSASSTP